MIGRVGKMYSMLQQSSYFAAPESRSVFGQCGHVIGENGATRSQRYRLTRAYGPMLKRNPRL